MIWWMIGAAWVVLILMTIPPLLRFLERRRTAWLRRIREDRW